MSHTINNIANVYHAQKGTPLMQCLFDSQTDTSITLMVSVQDFVVSFTETKESLYLHVKLLRQQSNGRIKRYSCQFQQLLPQHEEMLRQYVFQAEAIQWRSTHAITDRKAQ